MCVGSSVIPLQAWLVLGLFALTAASVSGERGATRLIREGTQTSLIRARPYSSYVDNVHDWSCLPYSLSAAAGSVRANSSGGGGGSRRHCFQVVFRGCRPVQVNSSGGGGGSGAARCERAMRSVVDSVSILLRERTPPGAGQGQQQQQQQRPLVIVTAVEVNGSAWRQWRAHSSTGSSSSSSSTSSSSVVVRLSGLAADAPTLPGTLICLVTTATTAAADGHEVHRAEEVLCGGDVACSFVLGLSEAGSGGAQALTAACPMLQSHHRAQLAEAEAEGEASAAPARRVLRRAAPSPPPPSPAPATKASTKRRRPPPRPARRSKPPPSPPAPPPPLTGRHAKPSPPPPPPPSPPPSNGSRVCAAVLLVSPLDAAGSSTYTFGRPVSCAAISEMIIGNLTDAVAKAGAALATPFSPERCSAAYDPAASPAALPHVMVCGAFASVAEAAKLQGSYDVRMMLADWQYAVFGRPVPGVEQFCPPPGFEVTSMVWGEDEDSLVAYYQPHCSSAV